MNVVVMQPYLFPYLGYYQLLHVADTFVIFDDVNFIKKGWRNRNQILASIGSERFTLPIEKISQNKKINQHNIHKPAESIKKLFTTLKTNYQKAPYIAQLDNLFYDLQSWTDGEMFTLEADKANYGHVKGTDLTSFLHQSILLLTKYLSLNTKIILSSSIKNDAGLTSEARIIDICKQLNATRYINPPNAEKLELYTPNNFNKSGIELNYIQPELVEYEQFNSSTFVNYLSILDLIANLPFTEIQNRVANDNLRLATK